MSIATQTIAQARSSDQDLATERRRYEALAAAGDPASWRPVATFTQQGTMPRRGRHRRAGR